MTTNPRVAMVAGVAFVIATVAQLVGVALVSPILTTPVDFTGISAHGVAFSLFSVLLLWVWYLRVGWSLVQMVRRAEARPEGVGNAFAATV